MTRLRDLGLFALAVVVAAIVLPMQLGGPDLDRVAVALALAGPAAGAALSLAVGRPNLATGALAGVGAYISGALAIRGLDVPLAALVAVLACAGAGALLAVVTARLDVVGLLAASLLVALGLAALTQALPHLSGGQAGLGPLPALGTVLPGGRLLPGRPRRATSTRPLRLPWWRRSRRLFSSRDLLGRVGGRWAATASGPWPPGFIRCAPRR